MGNLITVGNKHNDLKHVDFSDEELEAILNAFIALNPSSFTSETDEQARARFSTKLLEISHKEASEIIRYVHSDPNNILQARKGKSIRAFLSDLAKDRMPKRPVFNRVELELVDPVHINKRSTASLLCDREHGFNSRAGSNRSILSELRLQISENLSPWRSWKGASGDVVTCAWGPDSSTYAVGAAAPMNDEDLQYNRPGNLLRGNLISNTLEELPDHRIDRPKPETISSGPNSSQAVYDASDPVVYTTVSALKFAPDGSRLYTASHDKTVKIWDTSLATTSCVGTLHHNDLVTDLDVSQFYDGVFASASKVVNGAIQVYYPDNSDNSILSSMHLTSPRAKEHPGWELFPECLHWGKTQSTKHLLLAGFLQWGGVLDRDLVREGQVCLWDINNGEILKVSPGSQSVFTATWHPFYDIFATGGAPSRTRTLSNRKTTKSVVRVWDIRNIGLARCSIEYECPALDMQDLSFHPIRPNIIAAGCTDSATYIWDYRKPDEVLLKLEHGKPILDWDHTKHQEEADSGIMMTAWGPESAFLYTGSSDGVVKCWDTFRSPEDAFVRDVADLGSGVQSGAFSPDFTHLLIGDADGAVHVLSSAPVDGWHDNGSAVQPINLVRAHDPNRNNDEDPQNQGILAAKELLDSGQLLLNNEFGVGKGPNYKGPYARYARPKNADPTAHLLPEFDALQPYSFNGHKRPEIAIQMKGVIMGRKANIASTKELEEGLLEMKIEDYECGIQDQIAKYPSNKRKGCSSDDLFPAPKKIKVEVIDLSSDTCSPPNETFSSDRTYEVPSSRENPIIINSDSEDLEENIEDHESKMPLEDESSEGEMLEDDHWWPRFDEDVFRALGVRG